MGPTGSTVGLISNVSNHTGTLGPLFTGVESFRGFYCQKIGFSFESSSRLPERVDDGSHHLFDLGFSHLLEPGRFLSLPSGVGSVDLFWNSLQVQLFITDQLGSAKAQYFAVLLSAQHLGHIVGEVLIENWELVEQGCQFLLVLCLRQLHNWVACVAHEVRFGMVIVHRLHRESER